MLDIKQISKRELENIRVSCAYLFSAQSANNNTFLIRLNLSQIKKAYRNKIKKYHPDSHVNESEEVINRRVECFIKIQESYEHLISFIKPDPKRSFERRDPIQERLDHARERRTVRRTEASYRERKTGPGKIIAVGGAKGGIGKSIFATNLAVYLSSKKWKTVVVDLDLGGANLHLYLGENFLKWNINDFLEKKVSSLEEIMIHTKYGPKLIGGESGKLGAANIPFSRKLKLLRALKKINADYVIIDLGGDTTFNIIDFFLSADHGVVMTSCEPASYLDAYNFIKVAIFRKLNRLFGPESQYHKQKDPELVELIRQATISTADGMAIKTFSDLIAQVEKTQPHNLTLIREAIASFKPNLVVNMVKHNFDVNNLVRRIQMVLWKTVSTGVTYLGTIPNLPEIETSARTLVPAIAKSNSGRLVMDIGRITDKLFSLASAQENN